MTATDFPRCATCAHWQRENDTCGVCSLFDSEGMDGVLFSMNRNDGEAYVHSVSTSDSFGCINHSEITKEK